MKPKGIEQINRFKNIPLTPDEQLAFAAGAQGVIAHIN